MELVNNETAAAVNGDIACLSGENKGAKLALADTSTVNIVGVWVDASKKGYVGKVNDGLVAVNCVARPIAGQKLYLSDLVKGKATATKPTYAYFVGTCISDETNGLGYKALVQFDKSAGLEVAAANKMASVAAVYGVIVEAYNDGQAHDDTPRIAAAIADACDLARNRGGIARIRLGGGDFWVDSIEIPSGAPSLIIEGAQNSYGQGGQGTNLISRTAGPHMFRFSSNIGSIAEVVVKRISIDCANKAEVGVLFDTHQGNIIDMITFEDVAFYNAKHGGAFVSSSAMGGIGGENAIVRFDRVTFNLNSWRSPGSKATAIRMQNDGAWNWLIEKSNFFGTPADSTGAIFLEAGELTLRDIEFENAETFDIVMTGAARLQSFNVHTQTQLMGSHLKILPNTLGNLRWANKRIVVDTLSHNFIGDPSPLPAQSILDESANALCVRNVTSRPGVRGVVIGYTGNKEIDIANAGSNSFNGAVTHASKIVSQTYGDAQNIQELYSRDLSSRYGIEFTKATNDFGISAYTPGVGYGSLSHSAMCHRFNFGPLELKAIPSAANAAAGTARIFCMDNGSGKMQICVRYPSGAVRVLDEEP